MATACAWWTIMSCMNRTSSGSSAADGRGAAAVPVSEVFGSPGRPGWMTGAVGEVATGGAGAMAFASPLQALSVSGRAAARARAGRVATARAVGNRSVTGKSLGGSFYPIQRDSVLFA